MGSWPVGSSRIHEQALGGERTPALACLSSPGEVKKKTYITVMIGPDLFVVGSLCVGPFSSFLSYLRVPV